MAIIILGTVGLVGFGFISPLFGLLSPLIGADHRVVPGAVHSYWGVLVLASVTMAIATVWLLTISIIAWMLWEVVTFGRRRATLTLDDDALAITEQTLLRTRRGRWPRGAIAQLGPAPTGDATNEFRVYELRILLADGAQHAYLTGRDQDELAWLATVLRDELGR
ncbi:MAG: hypothetical protein R3C10_02205 [Pirellulales bacterium]